MADRDHRNDEKQDQVKRDHAALQESARRVDESVSPDVRNTPIQRPDLEDTLRITPRR